MFQHLSKSILRACQSWTGACLHRFDLQGLLPLQVKIFLFFHTFHLLHAMFHEVKLFFEYGCTVMDTMEYWVGAMDGGLVHVHAVNQRMETLGVVFVRYNSMTCWPRKYWERYWALKPSPEKFWRSLATSFNLSNNVYIQTVILSRMADTQALWEDLFFLCDLVAKHSPSLAWLLPELDRRVSASLRLAWIAAVAR